MDSRKWTRKSGLTVAGICKKELRRTNLIYADARDPVEHRNLLAMHYLNKGPGLLRVLRALKVRRERLQDLSVNPQQSFTQALWNV